MEIDPICEMKVDPIQAAGESDYRGKTYYFCSPGCKQKFDANPAQYAGTKKPIGSGTNYAS